MRLPRALAVFPRHQSIIPDISSNNHESDNLRRKKRFHQIQRKDFNQILFPCAFQPPDVFLEDQLEPAEYVILSPGHPSLPPALSGDNLPEDWRGILAAYGKPLMGGGGGGPRRVLFKGFLVRPRLRQGAAYPSLRTLM